MFGLFARLRSSRTGLQSMDAADARAASERYLLSNSVEGCESLAANDAADAALVPWGSRRRDLEQSAEHWLQRASLLRRLRQSFAKRRALDLAESGRSNAAIDTIAGKEP